ALNVMHGTEATPPREASRRLPICYLSEISLARVAARLLKFGHAIDRGREHGGGVSLYLSDPDGHGLELYYDGGGMDEPSGPETFDIEQWLERVWSRPSDFPVQRL